MKISLIIICENVFSANKRRYINFFTPLRLYYGQLFNSREALTKGFVE
jgi:hypothetical protein